MEVASPSPSSNPIASSSPPSSPIAGSGSGDPPSPQNPNPSFSLPIPPPSLSPIPATVPPSLSSPPPIPSAPPPSFVAPPAPPSTLSPPVSAPPPPLPLVSPAPSSTPPSVSPPQVAAPPTLPLSAPSPPSLPLSPPSPPSLPLSPPSPPSLPPSLPPPKPVVVPPKPSPPPPTRSSKHSPLTPLPSPPPSPPSTLSPVTHSPPPPSQVNRRPSIGKKSAPSPENSSSLSPPAQHPPPAAPTTPIIQPTPVSAGSPPRGSFGPTPSSIPRAVIPSQTKSSGVGSDLNNRTVSLPASSGNKNAPIAKFSAVVGALALLGLIALILYNWHARKKRKLRKEGYRFASDHVGSLSSSDFPKTGAGSSLRSHHSMRSAQSPQTLIIGSGNDVFGRHQRQDSNGMRYSKFFSCRELSDATSGFSAQNLLGQGGFGCVYKGRLEDGRLVAVKQLKVGGTQGEREFRAEVETISRIHHRHLVSLVGYCIDYDQKLLVYEYVPNNTLDYHLHGEGRPVMDWNTRVKVASGAARGIAYLHEDCHPRIIHRDIKSSNILLDGNFEAQVSDFGLAKLTVDTDSHVTTRVMGTFGYMAPEYASSGKLTDKSDVFSFGVVLLELISGRKPVDPSQPLGDESLVEWARPLLQDALDSKNFQRLADPRLQDNYDGTEMFRMVEAAAACTRHSAELRPRMGQVARALATETDASDLNNGMKPGQSSVFNNSRYSEELRLFQRMAFGPGTSTIVTNDTDMDSALSSERHSQVHEWRA